VWPQASRLKPNCGKEIEIRAFSWKALIETGSVYWSARIRRQVLKTGKVSALLGCEGIAFHAAVPQFLVDPPGTSGGLYVAVVVPMLLDMKQKPFRPGFLGLACASQAMPAAASV